MNDPKTIKPAKKTSQIINKTKLLMKMFPKGERQSLKDYFIEKLEKLFNSSPTNLGYKSDIESLLNDLGMNKDHLLQIVISCLSKTVRNKKEVKIIASYLFFMQDFLKLIRAKGVSEKETILLKDLITLSEAMIYEKQQNNTVMMRYGDKGSTAFIILKGQVDVLIENAFLKNLGEKTYLFYLANLIKYHEFGLVNLTVNDNFKKYPIEIIDDITVKNINDINIKKATNKKNNSFHDSENNSDNDDINKNKTNNMNNNINKENSKNNIYNPINNNKNTNLDNHNSISKILNIRMTYNPGNIRAPTSSKSIKIQKLELLDMNSNKEDQNPLSKRETQQKGVFKLNFINEELRDIKKVKKFRAKELLDMYGLKLLDKRFSKKLNHCSVDEYIQRLNVFEYLENKIKGKASKKYKKSNKKIDDKNEKKNEKQDGKEKRNNNVNDDLKDVNNNENNKTNEKKKNNEKDNNENVNDENNESEEDDKNNKSSSSLSSFLLDMNRDIIFDLKIYSYIKVVTLGAGSLFGEMALNDANALRKATIITTSDCHFSVLNKKTFNNCIRMGAQKHLRELLQFFIELPIFSGIPEGVFYHKYYTNLSKITIIKGKKVINQGDKPEHITLLKTGLYELTTRMSLYEITRLIFRYAKHFNNNNDLFNDKKSKNLNINNTEIKNKYKLLFQNVLNIMNEENSLLNDNIIFKKFYNSQQFIRIADIACPEVIINDEYLDDNGLFAFSIESKAPENIIYTLSNSFYFDLKNKNISVKKNQDKLLSEKINLMIERLLIIRNSLINSFFDYKSRNELGVSVIKELEEMIFKQLKKKRSLIKKDEKIIITNENIKMDKKDRDKKYLTNENNITNNHKNKKKEKLYLDTNSFLFDNNSYLKKKNKNNTLKLYQDYQKNLNINIKNKHNRKINSFRFKNKNFQFSNKLLNQHKKELSLSPENKNELTKANKEFNFISNFTFKDNEDELLFSFYEENKDNINDINIMNHTNYNLSRNKTNKYTQIKKGEKSSFNPFKSEDQKNSLMCPLSREVLMNNLIWENIKSVIKFPIRKKINDIKCNKTFNHFYKSKKMINNNLRNYIENNLKYITIRNKNKKTIEKISKTIDNKFNKNNLLLKEFSYRNNKIDNINNIYIASTPSKFKISLLSNNINIHKENNNEGMIKEGYQSTLLNLKMVNKSIDSGSKSLKIKKYYSPHQINFMRMSRKMRYVMDGNNYSKIKGENFKKNREHYYKKNIVNRMNYFYGNAPN